MWTRGYRNEGTEMLVIVILYMAVKSHSFFFSPLGKETLNNPE